MRTKLELVRVIDDNLRNGLAKITGFISMKEHENVVKLYEEIILEFIAGDKEFIDSYKKRQAIYIADYEKKKTNDF